MKSLLIFALILGSCACFSQNIEKIKINFAHPNIPSIPKIAKGDFFIVEIDSINLNLYKITLTAKDSILSKPQTTPSFSDINIDAISKIVSNVSSFTSTVMSLDPIINPPKTLGKQMTAQNKIDPELLNSLYTRMQHERTFLMKSKLTIDSILLEIENLKYIINTNIFYQFSISADKVGIEKVNILEILNKLETIRSSISSLINQIHDDMITYDSDLLNFTKITNSQKNMAIADSTIRSAQNKLSSAVLDIYSLISSDKLNTQLTTLVFIENNNSNIYTSLPIQFLGEQSKIKITITPRKDDYNLQSYSTQITFPANINTYTVAGLSFYGTSLHDNSYSFLESPTSDSTSLFTIQKEGSNFVETGIAIMLRYGKKFDSRKNSNNINCDCKDFSNPSQWGTHFALGAGISMTNKIKPRILIGWGVTYGDKHMITLDLGGITGYVDKLSDVVDINSTYPSKPESITVSKLGVGGFLSLGYTYQF